MEHRAINPEDAAALLQGGMRPAELRTLLTHQLDLAAYLALEPDDLTTLGLRPVTPEHRDLGDCSPLLETDPRYPAHLRALPGSPVLLYVRGSLDALGWGVGIIGTREMTRIGAAVAESAARAAAAIPAPVVSGLARGCDIAAHRAALQHNSPTVAVLACGLDSVYPPEHHTDLENILAAGGAVVSEQPFATPVNPQRLMARNRIIVGLSACVIPCEAGKNSRGTLQAIGTAFAADRFVLTARVRENWRAAPGAWLSERLALGDTPAEQFGWKSRVDHGPVRHRSRGAVTGVAANGVAESGADLAEMVKFSVLFARA